MAKSVLGRLVQQHLYLFVVQIMIFIQLDIKEYMGLHNNEYANIQMVSSNLNGGWIDFTITNGEPDFDGRIRYNHSTGFEFYTNSNTTTKRMIINTAGNVGIGTVSSGNKLHTYQSSGRHALFQSSNSGGDGGGYIEVTNGSSIRALFGTGGRANGTTGSGTAVLGTWSAHPLTFSTNQIEHMRIRSDGNVGIGTNNPDFKFKVNGNTFFYNGTSYFRNFCYFGNSNEIQKSKMKLIVTEVARQKVPVQYILIMIKQENYHYVVVAAMSIGRWIPIPHYISKVNIWLILQQSVQS